MITTSFKRNGLAISWMVLSEHLAQAEDMQFRGFFQASAGYNDLDGKRYLGWSESKRSF